jgi:hypothetical protein
MSKCPDCGGVIESSTYVDWCLNDCGWEGQYYDGPDSTPKKEEDDEG